MMHNLTILRWQVIWTVFALLIIFSPGSSLADVPRIEIPASMNPVGSGARALGMGGAFIGVADDATAASWNPGGLIQLETPEVSIVGAYVKRTEDLSFDEDPDASGAQDISKGSLNYFSAALPFSAFKRNMIISVNYQNLYDFARSWNIELFETIPEENAQIGNLNLEQDGSLSAIGVAYGIQVTSRFSFGLTLNLWPAGINNGWEQKKQYDGNAIEQDVPFAYSVQQTDEYTFSGINANLGILWNVTNRLTLGAVLKTPFTAELEHKQSEYVEIDGSPVDVPPYPPTSEELDMPMSYGLGLSYRFSDQFTVDIDVYRTQWDDYILTDENGDETSPVNGKPKGEAGIDPTIQVRTGGEYLIITDQFVVPLRGGVFYDPAPAEGSPDDYYGFSLGSGIAYKKIVFDMAYQFRFGNDVGTHLYESLGFSEDVREHTLYASIIYHF